MAATRSKFSGGGYVGLYGPSITAVLVQYEGDYRPAHTYLLAGGERVRLSRAELLGTVRRQAAALRAAGVGAGDRLALVQEDPATFVPAFLGALWVGAVPVALAPPPPVGRRDAWRDTMTALLAAVTPQMVCLSGEAEAALKPSRAVTYEALAAEAEVVGPDTAEPVEKDLNATAYLQFSSGSTGQPRAVVVSAGSLRANCRAIMIEGLRADPDRDVGVTWLPLHHDMGLAGFVLAPLTVGVPVVFLPTRAFVRDPSAWMRLMSEEHGTISFASTFAYALAARRPKPDGLNLSAVRVLGCGAEPINADVLRAFVSVYRPAGLDPCVLLPCYGLAESTLAVTFGGAGQGLRTDRVRRGPLQEHGHAEPAGADEDAFEVVECGRPFPGHEVTVVDDERWPLPERTIGEVMVAGPSVAAGYDGEPETAFMPDGRLRTGDLGYLADGSLFITGRKKDLLIVRGRNVDPQRLEWLAETVPGVRSGGVVAFTRPGAETEEVVVVAECRDEGSPEVARKIGLLAVRDLQVAVSDVVLVGAGKVPRTSSGKPRRQEARRRYLAGELR
ncbi:AMP-binding protein [Nonomuraea sp. NPDC048882]|uniref:AMP-binding protein n=1 Tax=Nonomuraea sp. NPDC048882 TaxID=3154347 RepID=UPI0033FFB03F